MRGDGCISPLHILLDHRYGALTNKLTSSASTTNSTWSDTTSQSSDDTSVSSTSDSDSATTYYPKPAAPVPLGLDSFQPAAVPEELRQNPRRTSSASCARPPALVRQCDRKVNFVDSLVDSSTHIVDAIWPLSSAACRSDLGTKAVLPLRTFIQETLRRSRSSYSTLQVALYYLILVKPHVPKYNHTMEQYEDHTHRALQCGRRMFLAALILASKYLQDRNYSARAWSKISGLNTTEINQNEISFLLAVNWRLHIADDVFQRWTEIVLMHTPPPPSPLSPGASPAMFQQAIEWRKLILRLNPELTNIDGPYAQPSVKRSDLCALSPRSILNPPQEIPTNNDALDATPKALDTASALSETVDTLPYSAARYAPALGLLPTPRLTPQTNGLCTPAASAGPYKKKPSAMCLAMTQANSVMSNQHLDRLSLSVTSSPRGYYPYAIRRSSLANSMSTTSSPESMISDMSHSSRSSSISSVSSLASATLNCKLAAQSRFRANKTLNERSCLRPTVPSVPEDFYEYMFSSSPESYTGPVAKLGGLSLDTPLGGREEEMEKSASDPACDAARALQDIHKRDTHSAESTPNARLSRKRSCPAGVDERIEGYVHRRLLEGGYYGPEARWNDSFAHGAIVSSRKRACCSTEAVAGFQAVNSGRALGAGRGMWEGILNERC